MKHIKFNLVEEKSEAPTREPDMINHMRDDVDLVAEALVRGATEVTLYTEEAIDQIWFS